MESLRGFPEFMRMLPELLDEIDNLHVVIAGADRRAYSYDAPSHHGSWKQCAYWRKYNAKHEGSDTLYRVIKLQDYRSLLWRTDLHCYFTRPYVTSWSLFEAAACGAQLAVNKSPATRDIVDDKSSNLDKFR